MTIKEGDISNSFFLEELKKQYDEEFKIKDTLEKKASNTIAISGTVATLLFGFGTFLIDRIGSQYELLQYVIVFLLIGVIANVIVILLSTISLKITNYRYAMIHNSFFKYNGNFDTSEIEKYKNMQTINLFDIMIKSYLKSIKQNSENNIKKAKKVEIAQLIFFLSMFSIPILLGILLTNWPK